MSVGGSGLVVESGDAEAGGGAVGVAAQVGRLNNDLLGLPSAMGMAMRRVLDVVGVWIGHNQGLGLCPKSDGNAMVIVDRLCGVVTALLSLTCFGDSKKSHFFLLPPIALSFVLFGKCHTQF